MINNDSQIRLSMGFDSDCPETALLTEQILNRARSLGFVSTCRAAVETDESGKDYCEQLLSSGRLIFHTSHLDEHEPMPGRSRVTLGGFSGAVIRSDHLVFVRYGNHSVFLTVWSTDHETAKRVCSELAAGVPAPSQSEDPELARVHFWCNSVHGPRFYPRTIECPDWDAIKNNYHNDVVEEIDWLRGLHRPDDYGRIIIWSGDPGTGKTWAIRSLLLAMKQRARIDVITDPQVFFGDTDYVYRLLMDDDFMEQPLRLRSSIPGLGQDNESPAVVPQDRFRLLILEDSAELVMAGCRDRNEGFTRLLNLADGLVGQGLRFLLLLTANEDLGEMDSAVLRHGRCLQNIAFPKFEHGRAQQWLNARRPGIVLEDRSYSLAELYAMLQDNRPRKVGVGKRAVGFGVR